LSVSEEGKRVALYAANQPVVCPRGEIWLGYVTMEQSRASMIPVFVLVTGGLRFAEKAHELQKVEAQSTRNSVKRGRFPLVT
jgi:hypothetical protein